MNREYSFIANSSLMLILCSAAIIFALVQSILFYRAAKKRALEIGLTREDIRTVVKGSAVFSIIPSLPIIITYMVLLPVLGKFFPWLRLSVIGSATYETIVANMAVTSYGYDSLGSADFPPNVFVSIMWIVTIGMMLSSLSVLLLRRYDNKMKEISADKDSFGALVGPIMFLGMMASFSAPYLIDVNNPVTLVTIGVSAITMLALEKASKKYKGLKEFAFSLSMIAGMVAASLMTNLLGV